MTYTVCSLKIYHICNNSGGFKSLTKWGTRSFNSIVCSLAYKEGGAQGPRGRLAPPVDRPWSDITRSSCSFFFFFFFWDWRNADAKAIQIIKIYDSTRSWEFRLPVERKIMRDAHLLMVRRPQPGVSSFHALVSRRFHGPVYFKNGFGANFKYLSNFTNLSAKPTDLKMVFSAF